MSETEKVKDPGVVERLIQTLREAEASHRRHEQESGCPHEDWSHCYAEHMMEHNLEADGYALTLLPPH